MIPKKLHMTYIDEDLPEKYKQNLKKWETLCPSWSIHYYSNQSVYDFFEEHFPEYFKELPKISFGAQLADIFRYAVIYVYGGMYTDIDTVPLKSIPEHWLSYEAVIGHEYQPLKFPNHLCLMWKYEDIFCQWSFFSKAQNLFFKKVLDHAFLNLRKVNFQVQSVKESLCLTGPSFSDEISKRLYQKCKCTFF